MKLSKLKFSQPYIMNLYLTIDPYTNISLPLLFKLQEYDLYRKGMHNIQFKLIRYRSASGAYSLHSPQKSSASLDPALEDSVPLTLFMCPPPCPISKYAWPLFLRLRFCGRSRNQEFIAIKLTIQIRS